MSDGIPLQFFASSSSCVRFLTTHDGWCCGALLSRSCCLEPARTTSPRSSPLHTLETRNSAVSRSDVTGDWPRIPLLAARATHVSCSGNGGARSRCGGQARAARCAVNSCGSGARSFPPGCGERTGCAGPRSLGRSWTSAPPPRLATALLVAAFTQFSILHPGTGHTRAVRRTCDQGSSKESNRSAAAYQTMSRSLSHALAVLLMTITCVRCVFCQYSISSLVSCACWLLAPLAG